MTSSRDRRRRRVLEAVFAFAVSVGLQGAQNHTDAGYLVPGPQATAAFAVPPSVIIPEMWSVPRQVRDKAARLARQRHKRAECNRFFQSGETYIVVLSAFCGERFGKEIDSRLLLGLGGNGALIAEISWVTGVGGAELVPYMRFTGTPQASLGPKGMVAAYVSSSVGLEARTFTVVDSTTVRLDTLILLEGAGSVLRGRLVLSSGMPPLLVGVVEGRVYRLGGFPDPEPGTFW